MAAPVATIVLGVIATPTHVVMIAHVVAIMPHFAAVTPHVVAVRCHFATIVVHVTRLGTDGRAIAVHVLAHGVTIALHPGVGVHLRERRRSGYGKGRQNGGQKELLHRAYPLVSRFWYGLNGREAGSLPRPT